MHFPFMHVSGYTCLFTWTKKLENLNANNAMYMNNKIIHGNQLGIWAIFINKF